MKKISKFLTVVAIASLLAASGVQAQDIVVRARLHGERHFVRPPRPTRHHIWVAEEWTPAGGTYVHHDGYWAEPARPGAVWVAGHWYHRHHGYVWVAGHWSI